MAFLDWAINGLGRRSKPPRPPHRTGVAAALGCALAAVSAAGTVAAEPAPAAEGETLRACLEAVTQSTTAEISCTYLAIPTEAERADMRRLSRGLLQDVRCSVKVKIARALVEPALIAQDHVFESPPQPVHCDITTKDGGFPVEATFAPRVVFKDGKATEATPGLANVTGINRYLAWPVVQYVNRAPGIRASMIEIIDALRPRLAGTAPP